MPVVTSIRTYALTESDAGVAEIYLSADQGETWFLGGSINETEVFDIKADPTYGGSAVVGAADGIYYTKDGGYTWTKAVGTYTATGGNFKQISYVDSDYVFAIGDNHVVFSQNGGIYFEDLVDTASLYGPGALGYSIYFADQFKGVIGIEDKVYITADSGTSWVPGNGDVELIAGEPVYSVAMNSDFTTINAATINNALQSTDFGATFGITYTAPGVFGNRQRLLRYSDSVYYLLSNNDGAIELSIDSGLTWNNQNNIVGSYIKNNIIDLLFYTATTGLFAPDATDVRKTTDSGITLTDYPVGASKAVISVSAASETCGTCPTGFIYNQQTNTCTKTQNSGYLCSGGYFNPANSTCNSDSDCISDIMFVVDISSSVKGPPNFSGQAPPQNDPEYGEAQTQINLLKTITQNLDNNGQLDPLANQIGVVQFSNNLTNGANLEQGLTSNYSLLEPAIETIQARVTGGTTTINGICAAVSELETNNRPGASKTIVLFTDGAPNECRTSMSSPACIYDGVTYPCIINSLNDTAQQKWANHSPVVKSLCNSLKNNGYTIILVILGTPEEIDEVKLYIGSDSDDPIYSTVNGVDYQFVAEWSDAQTLSTVLSNTLCINSEEVSCPEGWNLVVTNTNPANAYCSFTQSIPLIKCCFVLRTCDADDSITTNTDLTNYLGSVIQIAEYPDICWTIIDVSGVGGFCDNNNDQPVTVTSSYDTCEECIPRYKLVNCQDYNVYIYSTQDLSSYVGTNNIVTLDEYPNTCWVVSRTADFPYVSEIVTVGSTYKNCSTCLPDYYKLTNCNNNSIFIYVDNASFEQYLNKSIQIKNYPGICWKVETPDCQCIRVSIKPEGGPAVEYELTAITTLNGKNIYIVEISGTEYAIAWNNEQKRWELYNNTTGEVLSYSLNQSNCPFDGAWTKGDLQVLYVQPCINNIYFVEVDKVYINCECCLNNCV